MIKMKLINFYFEFDVKIFFVYQLEWDKSYLTCQSRGCPEFDKLAGDS